MIHRYKDIPCSKIFVSILGYWVQKKNTTTSRKCYLECTHTHIRDYYIHSHIYTHRLWTIQGA
jgi:hypothetical protein